MLGSSIASNEERNGWKRTERVLRMIMICVIRLQEAQDNRAREREPTLVGVRCRRIDEGRGERGLGIGEG